MSSTTGTTTAFIIPIKQQNSSRTINIVSLLMLFISLGAFLFNAIIQHQAIAIVSSAVLLLLTVYWLYSVLNRKPAFTYLNIILLLVAIYWFMQNSTIGMFMGIMLIVAAVFERRLKIEPAIIINATGVTTQTGFKTVLPWQLLANVIIKDGLLTIDAKSNKIWQKEVDKDMTAEEEAEINAFCGKQLASSNNTITAFKQ